MYLQLCCRVPALKQVINITVPRRWMSRNPIGQRLKRPQLPTGDHGEYVRIYRFKYMKIIARLSRMKVSQTIAMGVICTCMYTTDIFGDDISQDTMTVVTVTAVLAILVLFSIAHFSKRLIGIVWLDRAKGNVKIAHLTFWGSRKDVIYPVSSLSESGDFKEDNRNIFLKSQVRGTKEYYYYGLWGSIVYKPHDFIHVFGMPSYKLYKMRNKDHL